MISHSINLTLRPNIGYSSIETRRSSATSHRIPAAPLPLTPNSAFSKSRVYLSHSKAGASTNGRDNGSGQNRPCQKCSARHSHAAGSRAGLPGYHADHIYTEPNHITDTTLKGLDFFDRRSRVLLYMAYMPGRPPELLHNHGVGFFYIPTRIGKQSCKHEALCIIY
jgi:hypothetical protein